MSNLFELPLSEVVRLAASPEPTPGGGGIAGVTGAMGASMVSMVANLTAGKTNSPEEEQKRTSILSVINELLIEFPVLVKADMESFSAFMDALHLPKGTPEEKATRREALQKAAVHATEVPLRMAKASLRTIELALELAPFGNKSAISDVGVAAYTAEASVQSALLAVDINLPSIKDEAYRARALKERQDLADKARNLKDQAVAIVAQRMSD
jgi:formiminotetrahydrofolate cyclodeaminase